MSRAAIAVGDEEDDVGTAGTARRLRLSEEFCS